MHFSKFSNNKKFAAKKQLKQRFGKFKMDLLARQVFVDTGERIRLKFMMV